MTNEIKTQIISGISQIGVLLRAHQWRISEQLGLSPTQLQILNLLIRRGSNRVQTLAKLLNVTHATASDAISALHRKKLITKISDPKDGRATLIEISKQGKDCAAQLEAPSEPLMKALSRLSTSEEKAIISGLSEIIRDLQNNGEIEPQRLCITCRYFNPNAHDNVEAPHHCEFVNSALRDVDLRLDCAEHEQAKTNETARLWRQDFMMD